MRGLTETMSTKFNNANELFCFSFPLISTVFLEFCFVFKLFFFVISRRLQVVSCVLGHITSRVREEEGVEKGAGERREEGRRMEGGPPSYLIKSFYFTLSMTIYITYPIGNCGFSHLELPPLSASEERDRMDMGGN